MKDLIQGTHPAVNIPQRQGDDVKTVTFDETVPTLGGLKKMQDPSRYEKARFRFRLYPLRQGDQTLL